MACSLYAVGLFCFLLYAGTVASKIFLYHLFNIQVSLRSRFDGPSQMLILPTTFEPGDEAAFTFRVFSRTSGLRMKVKHSNAIPFHSMLLRYFMTDVKK